MPLSTLGIVTDPSCPINLNIKYASDSKNLISLDGYLLSTIVSDFYYNLNADENSAYFSFLEHNIGTIIIYYSIFSFIEHNEVHSPNNLYRENY